MIRYSALFAKSRLDFAEFLWEPAVSKVYDKYNTILIFCAVVIVCNANNLYQGGSIFTVIIRDSFVALPWITGVIFCENFENSEV